MKICEIQKMPTCIDEIPMGSKGAHESVLRSYHILNKAKEFLARGVPAGVVLELIIEMEE